jgi:hypothetical protein
MKQRRKPANLTPLSRSDPTRDLFDGARGNRSSFARIPFSLRGERLPLGKEARPGMIRRLHQPARCE